MAESVRVSPGVYTSEKDLTFVQRQVGVTTLGLAGETLKGPAFEPIFVRDYDEFKTFFGGQDPTYVKAANAPKYELPYIAKSYLTQSNQLFVTRVLGFSGYDAGYAWGITLDAALDPSTTGKTDNFSYSADMISYTATTGGSITSIQINDSLTKYFYNEGYIDNNLDSFLPTASVGDTLSLNPPFDKVDESSCTLTGLTANIEVIDEGTTGSEVTGVTSGTTTYYSGSCYTDVENRIVALLRSRGGYGSNEIIDFSVTGSNIDIASTPDNVETNPLATFKLTGTSLNGKFEYPVSFDRNKKNYITRVLGRGNKDGNTSVFVESIYKTMLDRFITDNKVRGINMNLIDYNRAFDDYKDRYQAAVTPYVLSEVRGNKMLRLFRAWTISDGDAANHEVKISIENVRPDDRRFDLVVRDFNDTDANPVELEAFAGLTMNKNSRDYIGRRIGTIDGNFESNSNYILIELDETADFDDAFPAGFVGYPVRDFDDNGNTGVKPPKISYKQDYNVFEKKRKFYLGISDTVGIDQDFFDYKGNPDSTTFNSWTATTDGYHLDREATGATVEGVEIVVNNTGGTYNPSYTFVTSKNEFKNERQLAGTQFDKVRPRKFTFVPYGGFDGWDIYRDRRTNTDDYTIGGIKGQDGLTTGAFSKIATSTEEEGITSDYYAYFEAIRTFSNPEQVNINLFSTPGVDTFDHSNLVEETIEMIEQERADSLYIVTTPDTNIVGDMLTVDDVAARLEDRYDSNYTATYWPWVQVLDTENNKLVWLPPTRDVVRNIALTDNEAFPWFAPAGMERGDVSARQVRGKALNLNQRDTLYANRINPIATFPDAGFKVWGQKTLQIDESALDRINIRRLLLRARKLIAAVSRRLLFQQNDDVVRNEFLSLVNPILENIRSERGLQDFRVDVSDDPEDIDRNELNGTIFIKPTPSLEYINIQFTITPSGADFEDI